MQMPRDEKHKLTRQKCSERQSTSLHVLGSQKSALFGAEKQNVLVPVKMLRGFDAKSFTLKILALEMSWSLLKARSRCSGSVRLNFGSHTSSFDTSCKNFFLVSILSCHKKSLRASAENEDGAGVLDAMAVHF